MELTRTTKVRINLPPNLTHRMIANFTDACNFASKVAFSIKGAKALDIQTRSYQTIRKQFGLSAQVAVSATRVVSAKYMTLQKLKKIPTKPVIFTHEPVSLQGGWRGRDFRFFPTKNLVSIGTPEGRLKVSYQGSPKLDEFLSEWELGGACLTFRNERAYLLVSFKKNFPDPEKTNNAVIGVDRGIRFTAVATDGKKTLFCKGGVQRAVTERYRKRRASIQSRKAQKNTRSIRRVLKRLRGREKRFNRDVNHVASKRIVTFATVCGCPIIAMENLKGIRDSSYKLRKKNRTEVNSWAFHQLHTFVEYKAAEKGFGVVYVDPRNTSRGCPKCGHTERGNRRGLRFKCKACGYELHADLSASRNIRLRGILTRQGLCRDGLSSTSPQARSIDSGWNPDEETGELSRSRGSC